MARASTYFFDGNDKEKQTLHRRIRPSEAQFQEQQDRWNALKDALLPALSEETGHTTKSWLQGSYKFGTQIRPIQPGGEFDIDLGVYFCWAGSPEDGRHGPQALKEFAQDGLLAFQRDNDDVLEVVDPPKARCCRIRFEGDFHIDVPVYHLEEEADARSLATEDNEWENSDPKAFYLWFTAKFDDYRRDRVRRLIRYLKAWVALTFDDSEEPPPSVRRK